MAQTQEDLELRLRLARQLFPGNPPPPPPAPAPEEEEVESEEDSDDEEPPPIVRDPNWVSPLLSFKAEERRKQQVRHAQMPSAIDADDGTPFYFDETKGQRAPEGTNYVPFGAVARYCYNSVPPQWLQPLASDFFDKNQIYNRAWDFYYTPPSPYTDAIPFVTEHQLEALINDINIHFPEAKIAVRQDIIFNFDDLPANLRPRRAGHVSSRSQYNSLTYKISVEPNMVLPDSSDRSLQAFKEKFQAAADAQKAKGKKAKAAKKEQFIAQRQGMVKDTLRAQRHLGLLGKNEESLLPDIANLSITPLDVTKPSPHPFEDEPIFIAIDAEAYEKPPRMVTEFGVATLDTRDLRGHAPEDIGKNWHKHIRARHFRIIEYKDRVNRDFVQGCPGSFEFGESEFVSKNNLASALASCFKEPFSKKIDQGEGEYDRADSPTTTSQERNIVLVGHDLSQDINYCHEIGFSVLTRKNMLPTVDTANLYRTFTKDPQPRSLGGIINEFDMTGWHLHNAGNDAVYTLHAMLAICVKSAQNRGDKEAAKELQDKIDKRIEAKVEDARERAKADSEGWESPEDEGGVSLEPEPEPTGDSHFRFHTVGGAVLDV